MYIVYLHKRSEKTCIEMFDYTVQRCKKAKNITIKGWVPWTERTIPLDAVLKAPRTKLLFLWRADINFFSQIFGERSAHRDGLDLFLGFCVHFWEGDIDDLEQKCLAEIVLVLCSLSFYRVTDRTL